MFGLFKRSKLDSWELNLLLNVTDSLPQEYSYLHKQISDGLIRKVMLDASDIPGYISFGLNSEVCKKYLKDNEPAFILKNIKIFDVISNMYINLSLFVSSSILNGYAIECSSKFKIDPSNFNVTSMIKEMLVNADFNYILHLFSSLELKLLNRNEIYKINVFDKDIYHLIDMEDGDFIGIDENNNLYQCTHDPYQMVLLQRDELIDYLKKNK